MGSVARYRLLIAIAAAVPLMLSGAACSSGNSPNPGTAPSTAGSGGGIPLTPSSAPDTMSEAGSTLLLQVMRTWAAGYHREHLNVTIHPAGGGSTKGIGAASAGTVSIGASDAYLSSGDLVKNPTLLNVPLAVSAQQVNYNVPGLPPGTNLHLDGHVLAQMYDGKITTWDDPAIRQLNPNVPLPSTPVRPLHRSDGSGDTFLFTSYLSTHDPTWNRDYGYGTTMAWPPAPGATAENGNQGMVTGCQNTVGCVAYVGISFQFAANQAHLGEAKLANTLGQWELPNQTSIDAAVASFVSSTPANETISMVDGPASGGYPIVNYEYAIVSTRQHSATTARDLKAFLHWIITTGNSSPYLGPVQFQPLPGEIVSLSDAQIAKIR
jgi:phosphate transport system substrate-binding protein